MADQKINALPTKTAPVTGDKCLMSGAAEEYLIDYDKLATAILNKLTSKTFTLDQGTKTLIAALNELNSKTSIFNASSPTDIDLNDLISPATYTTNGSAPSVRGWKNYPANSTGYVQIEKFGGIVKQTYTVYSGDMFVRCKITEWSSWKHITMENA